jgi:integrase
MSKLTVLKVRSATDPGRYQDGQGLMLVVKESGSRSWQLRIQAHGRRRDIGLGSADTVTLAQAREKAAETRQQVRAGQDPVEVKRASRRILATLPSFETAALVVHNERKDGWKNKKHQAQWLSTLESFAFPSIGALTIDKVTAGHVRDLLLPIWQSKPETARRVLQRIGTVLDWGHAQGHRSSEAPMRSIRIGLPRQSSEAKHFAALPYVRAAELMRQLGESDTAGRLALQFLILTAARSGEVRGATWDEIDQAEKVWRVPAERMKAKKEHVVPLSPAALRILEVAASLRKASGDQCVFQGPSGNALSDMTLTKVLRTAIGERWTVHGFRSSFRDWAAEETTFPSEVAEKALAHAPPNKVIAAYRRTDFLEKRRELMADWSSYLGLRS